jgi:hypothetical protein
MATSYSEKLKDPRWQRKRLEVFSRDNFTCVECGAKDKTLHVHHRKYSGEPWEAPLEDLQTLCYECHELITTMLPSVEEQVLRCLRLRLPNFSAQLSFQAWLLYTDGAVIAEMVDHMQALRDHSAEVLKTLRELRQNILKE